MIFLYYLGAFLIPYVCFLLLGGIPLFFMELSIGQILQAGPIKAWAKISPLFSGKGTKNGACASLVHVVLEALRHLMRSFRYGLPSKLLKWLSSTIFVNPTSKPCNWLKTSFDAIFLRWFHFFHPLSFKSFFSCKICFIFFCCVFATLPNIAMTLWITLFNFPWAPVEIWHAELAITITISLNGIIILSISIKFRTFGYLEPFFGLCTSWRNVFPYKVTRNMRW